MWLVIQWFEFNYFIYIIYSKGKYSVTPPMRVFVFSNYRWSLNNWNLLLELGKILKQKWHKTTKNDMLKLTYIKSAMKISTIIASTASHFWALKSYAPKIICFWFQIIQFYFILKDYFFLMCNWVECQWLSDSVCEMHFKFYRSQDQLVVEVSLGEFERSGSTWCDSMSQNMTS